MLKRFLPIQANFFLLFQAVGEQLVATADAFYHLIQHLDDPKPWVDLITEHELQADKLTYATYDLLHKTFITPFDRHDIHAFIAHLDDIVDAMHQTAQRIFLYKISSAPSELNAMVGVCKDIASEALAGISRLDNFKNKQAIIEHCKTVNLLVDQAEKSFLQGVAALFEKETNIKLLLKMKEVYEDTKRVISASQDFSNLMQGIILEYS